jgi:Cytochrome P460
MVGGLAREVFMSKRQFTSAALILATAVAAFSIALAAQNAAKPAQTAEARPRQVMPQYTSDGELQLPGDYRQWIFIGSSLGLSYSQGGPASMNMEMFHETLMEPTAYRHFVDTGTFREGTMLALLLHGTGEKVMPARQGKFATDVHGVEMAVKDTSHRAEGWAYYNFGGMGGIRTSAKAMPKESCYSCHVQHAKRDNVFLQFYGLLAEAAHIKVSAAEQGGATLALKGLDPVMLAAGREEMGKPEIVETHRALRYQFVSEPNRARFAADPETYAARSTSEFAKRFQ